MLSSKERIFEVLDSIPAGICDDCLSERAQVTPRQQVNSLCRGIEKRGKILRQRASCKVCQKQKVLNILASAPQYIGRAQIKDIPGVCLYAPDSGAELDFKRREIIQLFNRIEESLPRTDRPRETFSERLSRLGNEGKIPVNVVVVIRLLNNMRNLVVYENCKLGPSELDLIEAAYKIVVAWENKSLS